MKPGSPCPLPWPAIPIVYEVGNLHELLLGDVDAFVSEKLDGSNVSLSSERLVCSRRCVVLVDPDPAEISRKRLVGVGLTKLWEPLCRTVILKDLFNKSINASSDLEVVVYGELILTGTGSSAMDLFSYSSRGYHPGDFVAFGACIYDKHSKSDVGEVCAHLVGLGFSAFVSNPGLIIIHLNEALRDLLRQAGFDTVLVEKMKLREVFPAYEAKLLRTDQIEGVVVTVPGGNVIFKWKNVSDVISEQRLESFQLMSRDLSEFSEVRQSLQRVIMASKLPRSVMSNSGSQYGGPRDRLLHAFLSARNKYPSLKDELVTISKNRRHLVWSTYVETIAKEMMENDADGDRAFLDNCRKFVEQRTKLEMKKLATKN